MNTGTLHQDCASIPLVVRICLEDGSTITDAEGYAYSHPNNADLMAVTVRTTKWEGFKKVAEIETELTTWPSETTIIRQVVAEALWREARELQNLWRLEEAADEKWPERVQGREKEARADRAWAEARSL